MINWFKAKDAHLLLCDNNNSLMDNFWATVEITI